MEVAILCILISRSAPIPPLSSRSSSGSFYVCFPSSRFITLPPRGKHGRLENIWAEQYKHLPRLIFPELSPLLLLPNEREALPIGYKTTIKDHLPF